MINFKELLDCIKNGKRDNKIIFPNGNSLRLSWKGLDDEQGEHLVDLLLNNTIFDDICFSNNHLGPISGYAIARMLIVNKKLKNISLYENEIDDNAGAAIAGALEFNNTLQGIGIRYNILGPKAVLAFSKMLLVNKTLKTLSLSATFSKEAISAIVKALSINNTLEHIYLDSDRDTDQRNDLGLAIVEVLKVNKHLKRIDLGGLWQATKGYEKSINELTDETGMAIVKALEFNKTITEVSINLWAYTKDSEKLLIIDKKHKLLERNREIQYIEDAINDLVSSGILSSLKDETFEAKEAAEKFYFKRQVIADLIKELASSDVAKEFPHTTVFVQELQDKFMAICGGYHLLPSPSPMQIEPLCFSMASAGDSKSKAEAESCSSRKSSSSKDEKVTPSSNAESMDCSSDPDPSKKRKDSPINFETSERDPKRLKS